MATRPVFVPVLDDPSKFVEEVDVDFHWSAGLSRTQKLKNVQAFHQASSSLGLGPLLEVSTKSESALGRALSAFNLWVDSKSFGRIKLEAAFQGSKVFENGGPYTDLYKNNDGTTVKRDDRLKTSGGLQCFSYEGISWNSSPLTAFYDWLYLNAIQKVDVEELMNYQGFTDIEFNPKKSINCQARSVALYVSMRKRGLLRRGESLTKEGFLDSISNGVVRTKGLQGTLI